MTHEKPDVWVQMSKNEDLFFWLGSDMKRWLDLPAADSPCAKSPTSDGAELKNTKTSLT